MLHGGGPGHMEKENEVALQRAERRMVRWMCGVKNKQPFTAVWTLSGITRVSWYQKEHFAIFWIFWCKMKITQADTPTIRMDCHPIQTNRCPNLCHPHHFYAGCPS